MEGGAWAAGVSEAREDALLRSAPLQVQRRRLTAHRGPAQREGPARNGAEGRGPGGGVQCSRGPRTSSKTVQAPAEASSSTFHRMWEASGQPTARDTLATRAGREGRTHRICMATTTVWRTLI